ncbi:regulator of microtubule dynamics protein 1 isoform X1 [Erpetoichthys calabaricus]|uniref:regulator of microtubule dynamics protein 1 isoform X1 n=1 Tax=Erpetoichthys calabaricus TaxID=27687 RepID=UPI0022348CE4|nr:regulator of microtubule dynamics protein 1 isoform X1 [Erpetoichthys calabaricus]
MEGMTVMFRMALSSSKRAMLRGWNRLSRKTYSKESLPKAYGHFVFLLPVAPLPCLFYEAYGKNLLFRVVHAKEKDEDILEQADYLYGTGETDKLYKLLIQYKDSDNAEFLWRLARTTRDLSQMSKTVAEDKKKLTYEAFEYTKKALEANEACFAAHKWYAICISDVGDYEGVRKKIGNAFIVKDHLLRAIELNPKDATSIHILGLWCFAFAELPWYQRKIAAVLFAAPPTSTFEEALAYFLKAEEVDSNFYSKNLLMLGKSYMMLNNKNEALFWISKAKDYPAHTEEDKQVKSVYYYYYLGFYFLSCSQTSHTIPLSKPV